MVLLMNVKKIVMATVFQMSVILLMVRQIAMPMASLILVKQTATKMM